MARKNDLTWSCYISIGEAEPIPIEDLSEEEMNHCKEVWSERLSKTLNLYYATHPEEYDLLKDERQVI